MIRFLSLLALVIMLVPLSPVMAQEDADKVLAELSQESDREQAEAPIKDIAGADDYKQRLELSRKMHEIWPVRPKVETALEAVSVQIPQQERLKFKAGMRRAIKFEALDEASIDAMADIFSVKELEAMIAFYGSKEGRSVSHKTGDYERALRPVLVKMMDKAILDVKLGTQ